MYLDVGANPGSSKKEPEFTIGGCNQDYKSRPLRSHERLFGANEKRCRILSDTPATIKN